MTFQHWSYRTYEDGYLKILTTVHSLAYGPVRYRTGNKVCESTNLLGFLFSKHPKNRNPFRRKKQNISIFDFQYHFQWKYKNIKIAKFFKIFEIFELLIFCLEIVLEIGNRDFHYFFRDFKNIFNSNFFF